MRDVGRAFVAELVSALERDEQLAERLRIVLGVQPAKPAKQEGEVLFLTVSEAARRFEVSRRTIFDWLSQGLPSVRRGRVRRIPVAEASAWLEQRQ